MKLMQGTGKNKKNGNIFERWKYVTMLHYIRGHAFIIYVSTRLILAMLS